MNAILSMSQMRFHPLFSKEEFLIISGPIKITLSRLEYILLSIEEIILPNIKNDIVILKGKEESVLKILTGINEF